MYVVLTSEVFFLSAYMCCKCLSEQVMSPSGLLDKLFPFTHKNRTFGKCLPEQFMSPSLLTAAFSKYFFFL